MGAWTLGPRVLAWWRTGRHVPALRRWPALVELASGPVIDPKTADLAAATPRGPAHRVGETAGAPGEPPPPRRALRVIYAVRRKAEGATTWENVLCSLRF